MPRGLADDKSINFTVMGWCRQDSKTLHKGMFENGMTEDVTNPGKIFTFYLTRISDMCFALPMWCHKPGAGFENPS